jgi:hypothetical protein
MNSRARHPRCHCPAAHGPCTPGVDPVPPRPAPGAQTLVPRQDGDQETRANARRWMARIPSSAGSQPGAGPSLPRAARHRGPHSGDQGKPLCTNSSPHHSARST